MTINQSSKVVLITGANGKTNAAFPEREWVKRADVRLKIAEYEQIVKIATVENKAAFGKVLEKWKVKLIRAPKSPSFSHQKERLNPDH